MRWQGRRQSTNVEDRRGRSRMVTRGLPIGCGGLVLVILFALLGGDPQQLMDVLNEGQSAPQQQQAPGPQAAPQDELGTFASVVLGSTEDVWSELFKRNGLEYRYPTLVLFNDAVSSACGYTSSAVGPFYCPGDRKLYIDLSFFDQLARRFGAPGDFGQAYVIAHEIGHHVQNLLGTSAQVQAQRRRLREADANQLSVKLELQADCFAGVWGHYAQQSGMIEAGDFEEGLRAAGAIGDDQMQRRATGYVQPESWTHGSSEQRVRWLRQGLQTGDPDRCDTFQ
jgi:hypothetical protein